MPMLDSQDPYSVTVIIPTYNCKHLLPRALHSVFTQTIQPSEVIVVDDGSTDGTVEFLAGNPYANRFTLIATANHGAAAARNQGLAVARSEWIAFLDADDSWHPDRLARGLAIARQHRHLRWIMGAFMKEHVCGARDARRLAAAARHLLNDDAVIDNLFLVLGKYFDAWTSTMLIHRDCFAEAGTFETHLLRREDVDLWIRIALHFPSIGYIREPVATYHRHTASLMHRAPGIPPLEKVSRLLSRVVQDRPRHETYEPYARYLATDALVDCLYRRDRTGIRWLVDTVPHWLGTGHSMLAKTLAHLPTVATAVGQRLLFTRRAILRRPNRCPSCDSMLGKDRTEPASPAAID